MPGLYHITGSHNKSAMVSSQREILGVVLALISFAAMLFVGEGISVFITTRYMLSCAISFSFAASSGKCLRVSTTEKSLYALSLWVCLVSRNYLESSCMEIALEVKSMHGAEGDHFAFCPAN